MRLKPLVWCGILLFLLGCTTTQEGGEPNTITVFAAASLTEAFTELGVHYEKTHPDVQVVFNFAGSQQLAQQLGQGAPGDVFASANEKQMMNVVENGRILPNTPQPFTHNELIVIFPADNPGNITKLSDLTNPGLKIVMATEEVPVGAYSMQFLQAASGVDGLGGGFETAVLTNVVSYEQNVRSVFSKVALGEADAGIVYSSDVGVNTQSDVGQIEIPPQWNVLATYPIAPLADSTQPKHAQDFINFVVSSEGQQILDMYGFRGK
ncbi:MAG: molybdate ABC transporter substrate-binding protein [Chloroflexi bacterium]|nr:MAG: molybdate ABC transporter substrate-binding protein [Chloroflexota bacterium]